MKLRNKYLLKLTLCVGFLNGSVISFLRLLFNDDAEYKGQFLAGLLFLFAGLIVWGTISPKDKLKQKAARCGRL